MHDWDRPAGVKRFQVKKQSDKTDSTEDRDVTHDKPRSQKEKANTAGGGEEVYSDATSSDNGNSSGNDVTVCLYLFDVVMSCMSICAICAMQDAIACVPAFVCIIDLTHNCNSCDICIKHHCVL